MAAAAGQREHSTQAFSDRTGDPETPIDELVDIARGRVAALHERGTSSAYLYGAGDEPSEQLAGGLGPFLLLTEPPERFGLLAQAESPIQESAPAARATGLAAGSLAAAATLACIVWAHWRGRR